jgi:hypothetical protein
VLSLVTNMVIIPETYYSARAEVEAEVCTFGHHPSSPLVCHRFVVLTAMRLSPLSLISVSSSFNTIFGNLAGRQNTSARGGSGSIARRGIRDWENKGRGHEETGPEDYRADLIRISTCAWPSSTEICQIASGGSRSKSGGRFAIWPLLIIRVDVVEFNGL